MKKYSVSGIIVSLLLVFSIFTLLYVSEVNAAEVISVNASGFENTIIIELENDSTSKIKTVSMWPGGEVTFESFKAEPGWGGGKYSDGQLITFTATSTLNPGELVKFGLVTNEKIDGINWKALDQDDDEIDSGKITIQLISETESSFIEQESKEVEEAKTTGGILYGSKTFIPEKIRVDADVRLIGNGFNTNETLKLYLNDVILRTVETDKDGNFITTISIPETHNVGTSEFIIKDENGNIQSTNINIDESKNRFLKNTQFEVNSITPEIKFDESLTVSGTAFPNSAIILTFEDSERAIEKIRVISANANGEWMFEEIVQRTDAVGERLLILKNNQHQTIKNLIIKSDLSIEISTSAPRYNEGVTLTVTGTSEGNLETNIWIKDQNGKIIIYDIISSNPSGVLNYETVVDDRFSSGTYSVIVKQENASDATFFGVKQYPVASILLLMDKTNVPLNSNVNLTIIGTPSSKIAITILDTNDNIVLKDSATTSITGKTLYHTDLTDISSGVYRAVASLQNVQSSMKFSIGVESGSGEISLSTTKQQYEPGESILLIGQTGANARITITLFDPNGNTSSKTEIFSDSAGSFFTEEIGIPTTGNLGEWKITAHSRLDSKTYPITVGIPLALSLTLQIDKTEYELGDTITIKGIGKSDSQKLFIKIISETGEQITLLSTPLTADGNFTTPWVIPNDTPTGTYTIEVNDNQNSDSVEIFII